jgi:hypothetical protein
MTLVAHQLAVGATMGGVKMGSFGGKSSFRDVPSVEMGSFPGFSYWDNRIDGDYEAGTIWW